MSVVVTTPIDNLAEASGCRKKYGPNSNISGTALTKYSPLLCLDHLTDRPGLEMGTERRERGSA